MGYLSAHLHRVVDCHRQRGVVSLLVSAHPGAHPAGADRRAQGGSPSSRTGGGISDMTRVLGVFASRAALLAAIEAAKRQRLTIVTALVPTHDDEVIEAVDVPRSWAGRIAFGGGIAGAVAGLLFPAW